MTDQERERNNDLKAVGDPMIGRPEDHRAALRELTRLRAELKERTIIDRDTGLVMTQSAYDGEVSCREVVEAELVEARAAIETMSSVRSMGLASGPQGARPAGAGCVISSMCHGNITTETHGDDGKSS